MCMENLVLISVECVQSITGALSRDDGVTWEDVSWRGGADIGTLINGHRVLCGSASLSAQTGTKFRARVIIPASVDLRLESILFGPKPSSVELN